MRKLGKMLAMFFLLALPFGITIANPRIIGVEVFAPNCAGCDSKTVDTVRVKFYAVEPGGRTEFIDCRKGQIEHVPCNPGENCHFWSCENDGSIFVWWDCTQNPLFYIANPEMPGFPSPDFRRWCLHGGTHCWIFYLKKEDGTYYNTIPILWGISKPENCWLPNCGVYWMCPCGNHGEAWRANIKTPVFPSQSYLTELFVNVNPVLLQSSVSHPEITRGNKGNVVYDIETKFGVDLNIQDPKVRVWYRPYHCTVNLNNNTYTCEHGDPRFVEETPDILVGSVKGKYGLYDIVESGVPVNGRFVYYPVKLKTSYRPGVIYESFYSKWRNDFPADEVAQVGNPREINFSYKLYATGQIDLPGAFGYTLIEPNGTSGGVFTYTAPYSGTFQGDFSFPVYYSHQGRGY